MSQISADEGDFGTVHPATEAYCQEVANEAGEINKMTPLDISVESQKKVFVNMETNQIKNMVCQQ